MKKAVFLAAVTFCTMVSFGQSKHENNAKKTDSLQASPPQQRFALVLTEPEWARLTAIIATNGKLSGSDITDYLQYLLERRIVLPTPAETAKPK